MAAARAVGDHTAVARLLAGRGAALIGRDGPRALHLLEDAVAALPDDVVFQTKLFVLGNFAAALMGVGENERAMEAHRALLPQAGPDVRAALVANLAMLSLRVGDLVGAEQYAAEALQGSRDLADVSGEAASLDVLARTRHLLGDSTGALALSREAIRLAVEGEEDDARAIYSANAAIIAMDAEPAWARELFHYALSRARAAGMSHQEVEALHGMAQLDIQVGAYASAERLLAQAADAARVGGLEAALPTIEAAFGELALPRDASAEAVDHFASAVSELDEERAPLAVLFPLEGLALARFRVGDRAGAADALSRATAIRRRTGAGVRGTVDTAALSAELE